MSPSILLGKDLCGDWERYPERGLIIKEEGLTKLSYIESKEFLDGINKQEIKNYHWFAPVNAKKIIKAYELKVKALRNPKYINEYCKYLSEEGYFVD